MIDLRLVVTGVDLARPQALAGRVAAEAADRIAARRQARAVARDSSDPPPDGRSMQHVVFIR